MVKLLKQRILDEMVTKDSLRGKLREELFKEIGHRFTNYTSFARSFNKAWRKHHG